MKRLAKTLFYGLLTGTLFMVMSCAVGVKPYEREVLSDPVMLPDLDPDANKMEDHMLEKREGTSGGRSASGGGCGC